MVRNIINPAELGELFSDTIAIKRVSKTTKGGRVMSIAALVVVGDKNGHVGVGTGKAKENGEELEEMMSRYRSGRMRTSSSAPVLEGSTAPHIPWASRQNA